MEAKDRWIKSRNLIIDILKDYELGDAYLIIKGLDLIGYENTDFWFKIVDIVRKYKGLEFLVVYVDVMQLLGKEDLNFFMTDINNKYVNFNDKYRAFLKLLVQTKKYTKEEFNNKK